MNKHPTISQSRRDFLRSTLTTGTGTALAVIAPKGMAAVAEDSPQENGDKTKAGYRLTPHIADYYKTASF